MLGSEGLARPDDAGQFEGHSRLGGSWVATVSGFPTVGFYGNGEPTVNSNGELTVATAPRNYVDA